MRPIPLVAMVLPLLAGCSASVSLVLKDPIVEKCTAAGVQGCADLTDGVILFVAGDTEEGKQKVLSGAAANSPDQLQDFAAVLVAVGKILPASAREYAGPVIEVAKIITEESKRREASAGGSTKGKKPATGATGAGEGKPPPPPQIVVQAPTGPVRSVTADTDADRLETGIVAPALNPSHVSCDSPIGLGAAWCITAEKGPFVVTDLHAGPGCQGDVFAAAGNAGARSWALAGASLGPLVVHGGRLLVRAGETLVIGAGGKGAADPRCAVVWAGFKPYRPAVRDVVEE